MENLHLISRVGATIEISIDFLLSFSFHESQYFAKLVLTKIVT